MDIKKILHLEFQLEEFFEIRERKKSAGKKQATFSNATRSALENGILVNIVENIDANHHFRDMRLISSS